MEDRIVQWTKEALSMLENPLSEKDIEKLKHILANIRCSVMFPDADSEEW